VIDLASAASLEIQRQNKPMADLEKNHKLDTEKEIPSLKIHREKSRFI
jgi:hypothetical protein